MKIFDFICQYILSISDQLPTEKTTTRLLQINFAIAAFAFLANGGALLVGLAGKAPEILANLTKVSLIIFFASAILISSLFALRSPKHRNAVLAFHAIVIFAATANMLIFGLAQSINPSRLIRPSTAKIIWTPGMLTALSAYTAHLITISLRAYRLSAVKNVSVLVGAIAFLIDMYIFFGINRSA